MNRVFSSLALSFVIVCTATLPACTAEVLDEDEAMDAPSAQAPGLETEGIVVPQNPGKNAGGADARTADPGTK